jgi:hypothetical protein
MFMFTAPSVLTKPPQKLFKTNGAEKKRPSRKSLIIERPRYKLLIWTADAVELLTNVQ